MTTSMRLAASLGLLAVLAGCATAPAQCDVHDRDASLLTKMGCHSAYEQAETKAQEDLQAAREENAAFRSAYAALQAEQAASRQGRAEKEKAYAQVQASLNTVLQQVKKRHADKAQVQKQLAALEQEMKNLQSLPAGSSSAELKKRETERTALRKKVQQLELSLGYN